MRKFLLLPLCSILLLGCQNVAPANVVLKDIKLTDGSDLHEACGYHTKAHQKVLIEKAIYTAGYKPKDVASCEEAYKKLLAQSDAKIVKKDADTAKILRQTQTDTKAKVLVKFSSKKDYTITYSLKKSDGEWKIDSVDYKD